MQRTVSASIDLGLSGPGPPVFSVAVAQGAPISSESLEITVDGAAVEPTEMVDVHGTRLHRARPGLERVPALRGRRRREADQPPVDDFDLIIYLRPSRYCESDSLAPTAAASSPGCSGATCSTPSPLGQPAAHVRPRVEPADRRRGPYVARPPGRLPRLRAPVHRAAARDERAGPARRGVRPGAQPDGVPRGLRGLWPTVSGGSSTPPSSPPGRACCASPPAATPPTPRS